MHNVISYYSMLTTKPRGKYQRAGVHQHRVHAASVARNFSITARQKLGIGHKGTTPDGLFSLEEVECIGACSWAPAVQVNYDFHENLTAEKMDQGSGRIQRRKELTVSRSIDSITITNGIDLVSHPDEVKVVSKRFGKGATNIDRYLRTGRLQGRAEGARDAAGGHH